MPPAPTAPVPHADLEQRLERGEVIFFPVCPFALPQGEDLAFLLQQELGKGHKNISFGPTTGEVRGYRKHSPEQPIRLASLLATFADAIHGWVSQVLPRYCLDWQPDQVTYRPQEEAGRELRFKARNDLLHVDAFPNRPTNGSRILRCFANINPSEPRVWITGPAFAELLRQFGAQAGLPDDIDWYTRLRSSALGLFHPARRRRSAYDEFMLRFHDFLKTNRDFQENCRKQEWTFPPGCAWLAITDTCSHAVLRGRFALEHSWFVSPTSLALPEESPAALLERACQRPVLRKAG